MYMTRRKSRDPYIACPFKNLQEHNRVNPRSGFGDDVMMFFNTHAPVDTIMYNLTYFKAICSTLRMI